ncbi:MAG: aminopeptidase P N-terminal domain-containing protein [Leptospirales bacterium]
MSYREKLKSAAERMEKDSILVMKAPERAKRNRDVYYNYRTSSDLLYLTGLSLENFYLVLTSDNEIEIYMEYPDLLKERWEGKMQNPEDTALALNISKESIFNVTLFWNQIGERLKNKKTLYFDFGEEPDFDQKLLQTLQTLNRNNRAKELGPERIIQVSELLHEMRLYKTASELKEIQTAVDISASAFTETMKFSRNYSGSGPLTEHGLRTQIESLMFEQGATELAYPTIVAGGNNGTVLHYTECSSQLHKNDLVLIDAGCEWNGYASDITRTFPVGGKFSEEQKEIYSIVLAAQNRAFEECRKGNTLQSIHDSTLLVITEGLWELGFFKKIPDIDNDASEKKQNEGSKKNNTVVWAKPESVKEVIERNLYRHYYMHSTSHYLGLDVHDVGKYRIAASEREIEPGMVFTVEPGIYISGQYDFVPEAFRGIGIRIEDDVVISESGKQIMSQNTPSSITDIENLS